VIRLKASGDTISTGRRPFCSCPDVGSRLTSQISPRFIREARRPRACYRANPLFLAAPRLGIALGEQLLQAIAAPPLWLDNDTPAFNRDADRGTRLQVQDIEQRRRHRRMTEPPTFRRWVVCMTLFSSYILV